MSSSSSSSAPKHQPHIALLTFPFASHPGNLFTLARMLAAAASPNAAFSFFSSSQAIASLSRDPLPDNIRLREVDDGCPKDGSGPSPAQVLERIGLFVRAAPGNFRDGIEAAVKEMGGVRVSCVVSDGFLWMAGDLARELGVPWVALWTCGPAGLLTHLYTDELRRRIGVHENVNAATAHESSHLSSIPSLSSIRVADLPEGIVSGDINHGFAVLLHVAGNKLPTAAAVAVNAFHGMDPTIDADFSSKFNAYLPIGPFNLLCPSPPPPDPQGDDPCLAWLDGQAPASVAYISFGTVMTPPPPQLVELAVGLEASGAPFLWSLKDWAKGQLPAGFLERTKGKGLVVAWTPQVRVLSHRAVGAFVTHCGWNSIMESVTSGVPMVCLPCVGDQRANARKVSKVWRFGVGFDGGSGEREEIARALNLVLKEEEGREMRERVCQLKKMGERAAEPGGSSVENFERLLKIVCGVPTV